MRLNNYIEFYDAFLEELSLKIDIAILTGFLTDPSRIAIVCEFAKWVKDEIADDARVKRRGGSFIYLYALEEWNKLKPELIKESYGVSDDASFAEVSDIAVARYLADEANPDEQLAVIKTVGKYPRFKELDEKIKEMFRARPKNGCDQPA